MITYRTDYDRGDKLFFGLINPSLDTGDIIYLLDEEVDPGACFFTWDNPITMLHITEDNKTYDDSPYTCTHEGDDWLIERFQKCDWYSLGYIKIIEKYMGGLTNPFEFHCWLNEQPLSCLAWRDIAILRKTEKHLGKEMDIQPIIITDLKI